MSDSSLLLSREGVFPLASGNTGFTFSGTIQGEGKLAGMPSLFVRLQGCNLRCVWISADGVPCLCDTAHSSFGPGNPHRSSVDEVFTLLSDNMGSMRSVVITGGEPLLQATPLSVLIDRCLGKGWHVTVETNGTLFDEAVARKASLLSISPKLLSSVPVPSKLASLSMDPSDACSRHEVLISDVSPVVRLIRASHEAGNDVQLKFVVSSLDDEKEILSRYAAPLSLLSPSDVLVMPMGATPDEIAAYAMIAVQMCIRNGWRYSPRLHVDLWGNKEGV